MVIKVLLLKFRYFGLFSYRKSGKKAPVVLFTGIGLSTAKKLKQVCKQQEEEKSRVSVCQSVCTQSQAIRTAE